MNIFFWNKHFVCILNYRTYIIFFVYYINPYIISFIFIVIYVLSKQVRKWSPISVSNNCLIILGPPLVGSLPHLPRYKCHASRRANSATGTEGSFPWWWWKSCTKRMSRDGFVKDINGELGSMGLVISPNVKMVSIPWGYFTHLIQNQWSS